MITLNQASRLLIRLQANDTYHIFDLDIDKLQQMDLYDFKTVENYIYYNHPMKAKTILSKYLKTI